VNEGTVRARRCTLCSIQYPAFIQVCRVCGTETWAIMKSGPDTDWEEKVRRSLGEEAEPPADDVPSIAYVMPHRADVSIPLHVSEGHMWLPHEELIVEGGYGNLESGSVVFVNNRFYELFGYSESRGMWLVEEIVTDGAFDHITPEDIINGG
jgi:PAS domain-containing protein